MSPNNIIRRNIRLDMLFFGLTALTWISFFTFECRQVRPETQLLFALTAGAFSFVILTLLGYFSALRILPRKSDLFAVLLAIPIGGVIAHEIFTAALLVPLCPVQRVAFWTPVLATVIFGAYYSLSRLLFRRRDQIKVVLDLLPAERSAMIAEFAGLRMQRYLTFLDRPALEAHVREELCHEISLIIISRSAAKSFDADAVLLRAHLAGVPIVDQRKMSTELTGRISISDTDLWTYVLEATPQTPALRAFSSLKAALEPAAAALLLVLLSPLMLAIAAAIKIAGPGPVIFRQTRTGHLNRPFTLLKFRSMRVDSEINGPQWASPADRRVTRIGGFLRRTRLDELPQLLNVLRGEMSFFGPRPERPEMYERLQQEIPLFPMRTIVRPGITGWAQVCGGYASTVEQSRMKLEFDLYYIKHMSPRLDLIILIKTLALALFGAEASAKPAAIALAEKPVAAS